MKLTMNGYVLAYRSKKYCAIQLRTIINILISKGMSSSDWRFSWAPIAHGDQFVYVNRINSMKSLACKSTAV